MSIRKLNLKINELRSTAKGRNIVGSMTKKE